MGAKIKSTAEEQYKAERKRFLNRSRPKPVLAERIKSREERSMHKHSELKESGKEKMFIGDIY